MLVIDNKGAMQETGKILIKYFLLRDIYNLPWKIIKGWSILSRQTLTQ